MKQAWRIEDHEKNISSREQVSAIYSITYSYSSYQNKVIYEKRYICMYTAYKQIRQNKNLCLV